MGKPAICQKCGHESPITWTCPDCHGTYCDGCCNLNREKSTQVDGVAVQLVGGGEIRCPDCEDETGEEPKKSVPLRKEAYREKKIAFTCPHCERTYKVRESYRGKSGRCHYCKKAIVIPARKDIKWVAKEAGRLKKKIVRNFF